MLRGSYQEISVLMPPADYTQWNMYYTLIALQSVSQRTRFIEFFSNQLKYVSRHMNGHEHNR